MERVTGIEPVYRLWKSRIITIILYPPIKLFGVLGIEPSQRAPKARVLPVYDTPTICPTFKRREANLSKKILLFIQVGLVQPLERPATGPSL